jgi:signal peptidase II
MQAARGTSLSHDDSSLEPTPSKPSRIGVRLLFVGVFAVLYGLDQLTKHLAVQHLEGQPDKELVGELLQLRLVFNPGAAFSAGTSYTQVITCIAIAAVVVILWFSRRLGTLLWALAFGLLLAGVAGNLTDRLFRDPGPLRGHVVDFFMLPNWPVFNVADMCINGAAILILVQAFRGIHLDGRRQSEPGAEAADGDAPAEQTATDLPTSSPGDLPGEGGAQPEGRS